MPSVVAPSSARTRATVRVALCTLSLSACAPRDVPVTTAEQRGLVQLELSYNRDLTNTSAVRLDAEAHFIRYRTIDAAVDERAVSSLLGLSRDDELALGTARVVDPTSSAAVGTSALDIALLDAGALTVRNDGVVETVLEPHHYPELLPFVSGVVYGQEGTPARAPATAARVEIEAEGGEDVGPFIAAANVPRAFPSLFVSRVAKDIELAWTAPSPDAATPSVLVDLRWTGPSAGAVRVRAIDDGHFALAAKLEPQLASRIVDAVDQGGVLSASVARSERVALDAPGAGPGRLFVTLRDSTSLSSATTP